MAQATEREGAAKLAIHGGEKSRKTAFPPRRQFDEETRDAVNHVFDYYWERGIDFGSQGHFEETYTRAFVDYLGGTGYCDAVCSGTAAAYVALCALGLAPGSTVLTSPISDPGVLSAVIVSRLKPKLVDSRDGSYNVGLEEIRSRMDESVRAVLLVHAAGTPIQDIAQIAAFFREKGVFLIEDCSQAHGAAVHGLKIGNFGDVSVFSTMNTKTHASGGNGGLVFTRSEALYRKIRMSADRGKPFHEPHFDPKDPANFGFPALNLPQNELSSAIGLVTLGRLENIRSKRIGLVRHLDQELRAHSKACSPFPVSDDDSPFFWPIRLNQKKLSCTKAMFTEALMAEGIPINPHYRYLASGWPWLTEHLRDPVNLPNAEETIGSSFNLLFHENFGFSDMDDIVAAIVKVETHYSTA